jgi:protein phosphatase
MIKSDCYSISFSGRRKNNQDSCIVLKPSDNSIFLGVADGMGGAAGGEVASKLVLDTAERILRKNFAEEVQPEQLKEILGRIFYDSQTDISKKIKDNPDLRGMGTTLTCALILDDKFVWGNIGDSRIYWYSNTEFKQLSIDHTHIQEYIDKYGREISENFIENHGHILTRAINGGDHEPEIFPESEPFESYKTGDAFLLCSDGLILDKSEKINQNFADYLIGTRRLKDAAENLISYAYSEGSDDNITVVLCSLGKLRKQRIKLKKYGYPPDKGNNTMAGFLNKWIS